MVGVGTHRYVTVGGLMYKRSSVDLTPRRAGDGDQTPWDRLAGSVGPSQNNVSKKNSSRGIYLLSFHAL